MSTQIFLAYALEKEEILYCELIMNKQLMYFKQIAWIRHFDDLHMLNVTHPLS